MNIKFIMMSIALCMVGLSGCASTTTTTAANKTAEQISADQQSFFSKWVRDRANDYATVKPQPPIQLKNKHVAEAFSEEYKIPGE